MKPRADKQADSAQAGPNIRPRNWKEEADLLLRDYLRVLQTQFYLDDPRRYFAQRYMLVQAITWPARIMKDLGVFLPFDRQRQILGEIVQGIKQKGDTSNIRHFGAYFLHAVQTHVKMRQDHFYAEAKSAAARPVASMPWEAILQGVTVQDAGMTEARAAEYLVEIADTFKPKRRQKKAVEPKPQDNQGLLF